MRLALPAVALLLQLGPTTAVIEVIQEHSKLEVSTTGHSTPLGLVRLDKPPETINTSAIVCYMGSSSAYLNCRHVTVATAATISAGAAVEISVRSRRAGSIHIIGRWVNNAFRACRRTAAFS